MQAIAEARPEAEIADLIGFCRRCGLPVTLAGLGLRDAGEEDYAAIAGPTLEAPYITHLPTPPDLPLLIAWLREAEDLCGGGGRSSGGGGSEA